MYAISLTTIPPRLPRLGPVVESLLAQRPAPQAVHIYLPKVWDRFGAVEKTYAVPSGAVIHIVDTDLGPAMKAICFAKNHSAEHKNLIFCDDDWIYPQGWSETLLSAGQAGAAVAASGFDVDRLKRRAAPKTGAFVDIAQGFAGVLITPNWFDVKDIVPPKEARLADDIWLSGQLARQGIAIRLCPEARRGLAPAFADGYGLQDIVAPGQTRAEANQAALDLLTRRYGIWPPV